MRPLSSGISGTFDRFHDQLFRSIYINPLADVAPFVFFQVLIMRGAKPGAKPGTDVTFPHALSHCLPSGRSEAVSKWVGAARRRGPTISEAFQRAALF